MFEVVLPSWISDCSRRRTCRVQIPEKHKIHFQKPFWIFLCHIISSVHSTRWARDETFQKWKNHCNFYKKDPSVFYKFCDFHRKHENVQVFKNLRSQHHFNPIHQHVLTKPAKKIPKKIFLKYVFFGFRVKFFKY